MNPVRKRHAGMHNSHLIVPLSWISPWSAYKICSSSSSLKIEGLLFHTVIYLRVPPPVSVVLGYLVIMPLQQAQTVSEHFCVPGAGPLGCRDAAHMHHLFGPPNPRRTELRVRLC